MKFDFDSQFCTLCEQYNNYNNTKYNNIKVYIFKK